MPHVPKRPFTLQEVMASSQEWIAAYDAKIAAGTHPGRAEYWLAMRGANQAIVDACNLLRITYEQGPTALFYAEKAIAAL